MLLMMVQFAVPGAAAAAQSRLISEVKTFNAERPFWVAIDIQTREDERILFADSSSLSMQWDLPDGLTVSDILYPLPQRSKTPDDTGWRFDRGPIILVEMRGHPNDFGRQGLTLKGVEVGLSLSYSVCAPTCSPRTETLALALAPGGGRPDNAVAGIFATARANVAMPSPWPITASVGEKEFEINILTIEPKVLNDFDAVHFLPLTPGLISTQPSRLERLSDRLVIKGLRPAGAPYLTGIEGYLILGGGGSVSGQAAALRIIATNSQPEVFQWPSKGTTNPTQGQTDLDIWLALGFAFVGGMILNLMPCVFPVLAMKAFALVKTAHGAEAAVRRDGLAYTAGIIISFLTIAAVLLAVKGAGAQVGWGFQLQSPMFVLILMMVMTAVALNFLGVFSIGSAAFIGMGQGLTEKKGGFGAFATGVLASVVATPCTAPFMAPAIGFALAQPALGALAIFAGLGAGMAAPYLLISLVPPLRHMVPRPGPWMVTFRKWLALPLLLTVLWLFWVFDRQTGMVGLVHGIAALALMIWGLFTLGAMGAGGSGKGQGAARGLKGAKQRETGWVMIVIALLLVVGAVRDPDMTVGSDRPGHIAGLETAVWSPETVETLRLQGKPIFLNVTAAWCITCLVHEQVVFENPSFTGYLADNSITYMVADWTNPDARISTLLDSYGRSGVPFYLYYPADPTRPAVLLPQILTVGGTLEILEQQRS